MEDEIDDRQQNQRDYPEGGWGWVVCGASFMAYFIIFGIHSSFGIIYSSLVNDLNLGKAESAWVGSVAGSLNFLCGPPVSYLCKRYGYRAIAFMGAFLSTLGLFLTSFVKESAKMYLTYGLLWGVGSGMSFFPATIVLGHYFHHRFAMAVSITVSGSGIGGLLSAPFINFLLKNTGWKSAIRMLASCAAVLFFCALSYRRTGTPQGDRREERDDEARKKGHKESYLALLKIKAYIILVIAASLFQFCYTVPYVHIFEFSQRIGISSSKGSWLLGILSIASTLGKMVFGQISQLKCLKTSRIHLLQLAVFIMGLTTVLCPLATNYIGVLSYVLVYGTFDGCFVCQLPVVVSDIVGHSRLTEGLGVLFGIMAVPMSFAPPIAGWLYQSFGDYNGAFYVAGSFAIMTSLIMFTVPCLQHKQQQDRQDNLNTQDVTQLTVTQDDVTQQLVTQSEVTQQTGKQEDVTQHLVAQGDATQSLVTQVDVAQQLVTQNGANQPLLNYDSVTQGSVTQGSVTQFKRHRDVAYKRCLKSGRTINVFYATEKTEKEKDERLIFDETCL